MKTILVLIAMGVLILGFSGTSAGFNGSGNPLVVFTENSSTDLTATLGVVTMLGPDSWVWQPPMPSGATISNVTLANNGYFTWEEPEYTPSSPLGNRIGLLTGPRIGIVSDQPYPVNSVDYIPNGAVVDSFFTISFDSAPSAIYDVQFVDNSDVAVPEPSTMLLLGSGLIGLAGYGRKKLFKS